MKGAGSVLALAVAATVAAAIAFVLSPGNLLFLCPSLIITPDQVQELTAGLAAALDAVAAERRLV